MARELVTLTWCDLHQAESGEQVPAATWSVAYVAPDGTTGQFEVDACESCGKRYRELVDELTEFGREVKVAGKGRRPAVSARSENPTTDRVSCPARGCDFTGAPGGLSTHTRNVHGVTAAELTGAASLPCPVKGCDRKFTGRQGVAAHLRSTHPDHSAA
jgi:hypothetical protein